MKLFVVMQSRTGWHLEHCEPIAVFFDKSEAHNYTPHNDPDLSTDYDYEVVEVPIMMHAEVEVAEGFASAFVEVAPNLKLR